LDFKTSDIDAKRLIQDAMPKEGPKGSGAREALQNRAEWKGKLKELRAEPSKIPAELADRQRTAPVAGGLAPKPPRPRPPADLKAKDPTKTKEMLEKDLQQAAPDAAKEMDKAHRERWDKGFGALDQLVARSELDPETDEEIAEHLVGMQAKYGFTTLTHHLVGDEWLIDAAMSPGTQRKLKAKPLEGAHGTYTGLQGPRGDKMTPDHEPQHALMEYIGSDDLKFKGAPLFKGTTVAGYSKNQGICLNMYQDRHYKTRTYGASAAPAITKIEGKLNKLRANASVDTARKAVAEVVTNELEADHEVVEEIYEKATHLSPETQQRVKKGLKGVQDLNKKTYGEAFET